MCIRDRYAAADDEYTMRLLIEQPGILINQADKDQLLEHCMDLEELTVVLRYLALDINTRLAIACKQDNLILVNKLLRMDGIDVNKTMRDADVDAAQASYSHHYINLYDGETPLYIACDKGHSEIVNALLSIDGIDVNQPNKYGETPLYLSLIHI